MIKLVVGLANPGSQYANTRHNAGAWFVEQLLSHYPQSLKTESKFKADLALVNHAGEQIRIAIPTTYMNDSGVAVQAIANFYKITIEEVLIVHDDIDLQPGDIRLKKGGGHGGHNGLRSINSHLGSADYSRLRIGVGHPGEKSLVVDYVLHQPRREEREAIDDAITKAINVFPILLGDGMQKAMTALHS